jgi:hypothetical protein
MARERRATVQRATDDVRRAAKRRGLDSRRARSAPAPNSAACHAACAATPIPGPSCRISTRTGPALQRAAAGLFQRELRSTNCNSCAIGTYSSHGQPGAALTRRGIVALAATASDRCLFLVDAARAPTGQWETRRRAFLSPKGRVWVGLAAQSARSARWGRTSRTRSARPVSTALRATSLGSPVMRCGPGRAEPSSFASCAPRRLLRPLT